MRKITYRGLISVAVFIMAVIAATSSRAIAVSDAGQNSDYKRAEAILSDGTTLLFDSGGFVLKKLKGSDTFSETFYFWYHIPVDEQNNMLIYENTDSVFTIVNNKRYNGRLCPKNQVVWLRRVLWSKLRRSDGQR